MIAEATSSSSSSTGLQHSTMETAMNNHPSFFLYDRDSLTRRCPAIMLMILPTPLLILPPRRRVLPLPLQPPHQLPQESLIPAILHEEWYQQLPARAKKHWRTEKGARVRQW